MVRCCWFHYILYSYIINKEGSKGNLGSFLLFNETNIKAIHDISYIVLEMSSEQDTTVVPLSADRLLGQVKWFNNKAGYGFITVNDGDFSGKDIFIHYSAIRVTNSQYKYLVQGEYVEFSLVKSSTDGHEFQAVDISGVKCFLPGSLAAANKITDFESYLGKTIYVMIDGYVAQKDIFVVSYKKYLNKIMDQKIQELDLTKKYKGCVTGSSPFGLFVEWEDVYTGLIHKTEFEDQVVQGFNSGDEIEFYVKEVKEDNKLTLTFGAPVEKTVKIYEIKDQVENGTIEPMAAVIKYKRKNGCLVEVPETGMMAMIPQDKITSDLKNAKPGDRIAILIYEVDPVMGKIFAKSVDVY